MGAGEEGCSNQAEARDAANAASSGVTMEVRPVGADTGGAVGALGALGAADGVFFATGAGLATAGTGFGAVGGRTGWRPVGCGGRRGVAGCSNHAEARAAAWATSSGLNSALGAGGGAGGGTGAACRTTGLAGATGAAATTGLAGRFGAGLPGAEDRPELDGSNQFAAEFPESKDSWTVWEGVESWLNREATGLVASCFSASSIQS